QIIQLSKQILDEAERQAVADLEAEHAFEVSKQRLTDGVSLLIDVAPFLSVDGSTKLANSIVQLWRLRESEGRSLEQKKAYIDVLAVLTPFALSEVCKELFELVL